MSWYVDYYIGIMDTEGKIKPLGPYTVDGELRCIRSTSRSFTTDLHHDFYVLKKERFTDELRKAFEYYTSDECELSEYFGYLPIDELPKGDYIKRGYFLTEAISEYLKGDVDELYEMLTPEEYAFKLENELKFGKPQPRKDEFGDEICDHSCSEYSYFCYPNYYCVEYESWLFKHEAYILMDSFAIPEGSKLVIIKTEG